MLERQGLVLCSWATPDGATTNAAPQRTVLDSATGEALGFVRRAGVGPAWLSWLLPVVLEVYETEDASLLCTFRGPSLVRRAWEVGDADARRVGWVLPLAVLDADGRRQAVLQRGAEGGGKFLDASGLELAAFAPSERGTVLTFTPAVEGNPFVRMALLGATVAAGG